MSLSLPLNVEGEVTLPLLYDPLEGLFVNSDLTSLEVDNVQGLDTSSCSKCTPHEALEVIESALSSEQKLQFNAALLSGINTRLNNDPLYQSWKHYTQQVHQFSGKVNTSSLLNSPPISANIQVPTTSLPVSSDSSAFSIANKMYPLPSRPPVKKTKKTEYFVITADEVIHQKKEAAGFKIKQEEIKQQKRLKRERKRSEKIIKKATKTNPKKGHTELQDLL